MTFGNHVQKSDVLQEVLKIAIIFLLSSVRTMALLCNSRISAKGLSYSYSSNINLIDSFKREHRTKGLIFGDIRLHPFLENKQGRRNFVIRVTERIETVPVSRRAPD